MPDFSVQDSFNASEGYIQVKFGNGAKLLENELNESQKILAYKTNLLGRTLMTDGFLNKGAITVSSGVMTVPADTLVALGAMYEVLEPMTISVASTDTIYVAVYASEVNGSSTIYKSGNLSGGSTLNNDIYDVRMGGLETTRRVQVQIQLTKTNSGIAGATYLPVATMTGASTFTDNRIKSSLAVVDYVARPAYAVATGTANTYAVTLSPAPTAYVDGFGVVVKINVASTGASTLNVNGLGAISILDSLGNPITSGGLKANTPYTFRYNGTSFILQGKGGGGNATASQLLLNKTATVDAGQITGTMPDKTASATAITPSTADQAIPQGYYPGAVGDGKVKGDANLVTANIKSGVTIFGVAGKSSVVETSTGTATAGQILSGKIAFVNGASITGTMPDKTASATVITPGTADQAIPQGYFPGAVGDGKVKGDANLVSANIRNGVTIFGVVGSPTITETASGTATAGQILSGKIAFVNGATVTGTMPDKTASATVITPSTADQAIPQGYFPGAVGDGKVKGDANLVTANIKSGVTIFGVAGKSSVVETASGTATAGQILSGKIAFVNGASVTGTMTDKTNAGLVLTPSTADQAIPQGYYPGTTADGKVAGDANLVTANIKSGVTIFGVAGKSSVVETSSGTATAGQILAGKVAFVNGATINGSMTDKTASATVITPSTADQAIPQGYYPGTTSDGKVKGDPNLVAGNIRNGFTIFGISGTVVSTIVSATAPTGAVNGDIWIRTF